MTGADVGLLLVINLVVNVIPIMVQRYNRARIVCALGVTARDLFDPHFWSSTLLAAPRQRADANR